MSERGSRLDIDWLLAIMDVAEQEAMREAVKQMSRNASETPVKIFVSTPNGPANRFWELCREAAANTTLVDKENESGK